MLKKISVCIIILAFLLCVLFCVKRDKNLIVTRVVSPVEFVLETKDFKFADLETFDRTYSEKNKNLAKNLGITETEAFILGNLAYNWAYNLMKGQKVFVKNNSDIIYFKYSYRTKLFYSGYCLKDGKPCFEDAYNHKLKGIKRAKYKVLDLKTDKIYEPNDINVRNLESFLLIRKSHLPKKFKQYKLPKLKNVLDMGKVKVFLTDSTITLRPSDQCTSSICKEILDNINKSQKTIDMAIYGYSRVPELEKALESAKNRGVKVRLIYDVDAKGNNIYPDTDKMISLISNNKNDGMSLDSRNIMHNKFYIFDNKILITGSANLSHTDMSGFNSNSVVVIESTDIANIYKTEFDQMFRGKFHAEKNINQSNSIKINNIELKPYFSPQEKAIKTAILPIIKNAKKYIYIPTFVMTEKSVVEELILAKNRGVDVKIIIDALNASMKYSKHQELRNAGILVKTENYAGKMHSKSIIVDDMYTIIGSMNLSYSGENKNDENLVVIKNSDIAKFYRKFFLYQWDKIDNKWLKFNVRAESKDSIGSCSDGIDNNYDKMIDNEDVACH